MMVTLCSTTLCDGDTVFDNVFVDTVFDIIVFVDTVFDYTV